MLSQGAVKLALCVACAMCLCSEAFLPALQPGTCARPAIASRAYAASNRVVAPALTMSAAPWGGGEELNAAPAAASASPSAEAPRVGKLARLRNRIKAAFMRAMMGYDEEEHKAQAEYAESMRAFAVRGMALEEAMTTAAALEEQQQRSTVVSRSDDFDDLLGLGGEGIVELDVGSSASPMEEDIMASLRRRMQEVAPIQAHEDDDDDTTTEDDTRMMDVEAKETPKRRPIRSAASSSSSGGGVAMAPRPEERAAEQAEEEEEEPQLASAADIERLRRMFGGSASD
ncbi:hypothetical protein JKP88DRAFT_223210 [Tribonema minus]|uniref:Uncharacterized protein n=1 Tax=Tribonema minus TaxID=303371 RepID=A0A835YSK9_9STRA|nr:hypothetical protein JKP88DRAFT_223210 [Tribonema minus]